MERFLSCALFNNRGFNDWLRILNIIQGKWNPLKNFKGFEERDFLRFICPQLIELGRWVGGGAGGRKKGRPHFIRDQHIPLELYK